jgi:hypothetical protein
MFGFFSRNKFVSVECLECAKLTRIASVQKQGEVRRCDGCDNEIPMEYVNNYADARPIYFPVLGWTRIGKTIWMYSLLKRLKEISGTLWPDFKVASLDQNGKAKALIDSVYKLENQTEAPAGTSISLNEHFSFLLKNMPRWKNRTLILKDLAGEPWSEGWFEKNWETPIARQLVQLLSNNTTAMMFFSIADLESGDRDFHSMEQLLESYRTVLQKNGVDIAGQHRRILVVLTQAGRLTNLDENVREYLNEDPISVGLNPDHFPHIDHSHNRFDDAGMAEYFQRMKLLSQHLRGWIANAKGRYGGPQFLSTAKDLNISLEFCVTSCFSKTVRRAGESFNTSGEQNTERIGDVWHRERVLDPLFWALEMQSARRSSK